ncbi:MAG: phosphoribosylaminoimidazolesuccinocarboxamide synthase [Candidatus Microsyncoccus archaeolyticus]|nr:MAG: phosphoribosylaminoimidazolesuccinocarboxamide synthase [Candidatus Parcubacteria bacterium]
METKFSIPGFEPFKKGKVRELYNIPCFREDLALCITTDQISAFDKVIGNIKGKGIVLNRISNFWKKYFNFLIRNDVFEIDSKEIFYNFGIFEDPSDLFERSTLIQKIKPLPFEFIVRGYLAGGIFEEYENNDRKPDIYFGNFLPGNLEEADRLSHPIFTPSTKAEKGHDINITFWDVAKEIGYLKTEHIMTTSIAIYAIAHQYLLERGVILVDTKFEFGFVEDSSGDKHLCLLDEVLTPDSSRFWDIDAYNPGSTQESFDKQPFRDWLIKTGWDKKSQPPEIPQSIEEETIVRYKEIERRILSN